MKRKLTPSQKWRAKNKEKSLQISRDSMRRIRLRRYGYTEDSYKTKFEEQKGKCAIPSCARDATVPDHDHNSSKPRGLLCAWHNKGLGFFSDSPIALREAADYLEFWKDN